jgi:hypothetical protein
MEAYLYKDQMKSEPAFPPDQCQETANLLEEFARRARIPHSFFTIPRLTISLGLVRGYRAPD